MPDKLDEIDKELLGETNYENGTMEENMSHEITDRSVVEDCANTLAAMACMKVEINQDDKGLAFSPQENKYSNLMKRGASPVMNASDDDKHITKRTRTKTAKAAANMKSEGRDGKDDKSSMAPPKKPANPNKKGIATVIKTEQQDGTEIAKGDAENKPQTPSPQKRRSATRKKTTLNSEEAVSPTKPEGVTVRNTPRQRTAPQALAAGRRIPDSWEAADDADRMLVTMKEAGNDWTSIRDAWKEKTGSEAAASTLPNRYNRLKANMMRLKDGEEVLLIAAKKEADAEFWSSVANKMTIRGTANYAPSFLVKKFKELEDLAATNGTTLEGFVQHEAAAASGSSNSQHESQPDSQTTASNTQLSDEDIAAGKAIDAFVEPQGDSGGSQ